MPTLDHGALTQEVMNLKDGHAELRKEFRILDTKMDSGFALLSQKLDQKSEPRWQAIGVGVTVLLAIGAALYYPVREGLSENKASLVTLRAGTDERIRRVWEDNQSQTREIFYLKGQLNPLPAR